MKTRYWPAYAAGLLVSLVTHVALAQPSLVRIEEDWQLHVTQPDMQLDAPQVTTTMIPFASQPDLLLQVDLNHGTHPAFTNGGLQLRASIDDECAAQARSFSDVRLQHDFETVDWTQVVELTENGFYFGIIHGNSQTWGSFGGSSTAIYVAASAVEGNLSLDGYSAQQSLSNSGVTYASNRIGHLRLKKIRVYLSNGYVSEFALDQDAL